MENRLHALNITRYVLREKTERACMRCGLFHESSASLVTEGSETAPLLLMIDTPFAAAANTLLTAMLKAIQLDRDAISIAYLLCCHPDKNFSPALNEHIKKVRPRVLLGLGKLTHDILSHSQAIEVPIILSHHPNDLLIHPEKKRKAWQDLQLVMQTLAHD